MYRFSTIHTSIPPGLHNKMFIHQNQSQKYSISCRGPALWNDIIDPKTVLFAKFSIPCFLKSLKSSHFLSGLYSCSDLGSSRNFNNSTYIQYREYENIRKVSCWQYFQLDSNIFLLFFHKYKFYKYVLSIFFLHNRRKKLWPLLNFFNVTSMSESLCYGKNQDFSPQGKLEETLALFELSNQK